MLEPVNCFRCNSSPNDEVGSNVLMGKTKFGSHELEVSVIHDGKGGIKSFQTHDLDSRRFGAPYRFPGYTEQESHYGRGISVLTHCNSCETPWSGTLDVELQEADRIYIAKSIDVLLLDSEIDNITFKLSRWQQNSRLYTFSRVSGGIRIAPDLDSAVRIYQEKLLDLMFIHEDCVTLLKSIRHSKVPTDRLLSYLVENLQNVESGRVNYRNELARTVAEYDIAEEKATYAKSALVAAMVILHHYDPESTAELLKISGLNPKDFESDLKYGRWFFLPKHNMPKADQFYSFFGWLCGPNHFLEKLREAEP